MSAIVLPLIPLLSAPLYAITDALLQRLFAEQAIGETTIQALLGVRFYALLLLCAALFVIAALINYRVLRALYDASAFRSVAVLAILTFVMVLATLFAYAYLPMSGL